jgi:hypothetical protein
MLSIHIGSEAQCLCGAVFGVHGTEQTQSYIDVCQSDALRGSSGKHQIENSCGVCSLWCGHLYVAFYWLIPSAAKRLGRMLQLTSQVYILRRDLSEMSFLECMERGFIEPQGDILIFSASFRDRPLPWSSLPLRHVFQGMRMLYQLVRWQIRK